ncbi:MAG: C69 family dipeptidase [Spirochaetales bacterium]|nr:C69 family dipeptidase [Spirochaetales bacterium]
MKKRVFIAVLMILCLCAQSVFACTIFAVGKNASDDGSTMISHTCDSTGDDLRLWMIPEMPAGVARDIVLDGRAGADYSQFPEVKDYGTRGMALAEYVPEKETNRYIHAMYSFMNDKGLAMGESTCSINSNIEQGQKIRAAYREFDGIIDCYMIQDLALENCATAREAVEFMGALIDEYGWNGSPECINICDGNEAWIMECYGAHVWVAAKVPDDAVFVAANRARINFLVEDDPETYLYAPALKDFVAKYDLWDGTDWSEFIPCWTFAPYGYRPYSTRREWRAMSLLNPELGATMDPEEQDPDRNWPCFVVPSEPVSVQTIYEISGDYYAGTEYDVSESIWGGQFGDALNPAQDFSQRAINSYRCTYVQIANVKAWLPEEVRCLVWYGCGASDTNYLTPLFGSMTELDPMFTHGLRSEYDPNTAWWTAALVQQLSRINYRMAREDIHAKRDGIMAAQYEVTAALQDQAAKLVKLGEKDKAVALLTTFANSQARMWKGVWDELTGELIAKYMFGAVNMNTRAAGYTDFWNALNASEWGVYK